MTKMKKLLAVVLVCAIMAVCGASAFAAQNSAAARGSYPIPDSGIPYEIVAPSWRRPATVRSRSGLYTCQVPSAGSCSSTCVPPFGAASLFCRSSSIKLPKHINIINIIRSFFSGLPCARKTKAGAPAQTPSAQLETKCPASETETSRGIIRNAQTFF